jgi:hypothetical protein
VHHDVRDGYTAARIDALGNRAFALGGGGRRCGGHCHWWNMYGRVHHGLMEIIPCRRRDLEWVREVREMELRAEWEGDELVYYHYWMKVRPVIDLGKHEGVDEWVEGGVHGGRGVVRDVGGRGLIWDTGALVLTVGAWPSFRRAFSDFDRGGTA